MAGSDAIFRVGALLVDGFSLMSYASVVEPLRAANILGGREIYRVSHIPATGAVATSSTGAILAGEAAIGDDPDFDLLLVIAGGNPFAFHDERLFAWLRRLSRGGVRLGGVSGGPVILVSAGLMEGRRMTVHWEHVAGLAERYPSLLVEHSLYVMDRNRVTCAGGTAPLDLMHAIISEHHGGQFAWRISDWFMHTEVRPAGGKQRAGRIQRYGTTNGAVLDTIEAMENHIADPLSLEQLTSLSGLSKRQTSRLFSSLCGQPVMSFYRDLRLETARNLLTNSSMRIVEIALATGFANAAHFSRVFGACCGMTPSDFRKRG
ncbi:MAG: GlxA family transcriptional regulator [Alphaproteobacteria bacterium]